MPAHSLSRGPNHPSMPLDVVNVCSMTGLDEGRDVHTTIGLLHKRALTLLSFLHDHTIHFHCAMQSGNVAHHNQLQPLGSLPLAQNA